MGFGGAVGHDAEVHLVDLRETSWQRDRMDFCSRGAESSIGRIDGLLHWSSAQATEEFVDES